MIFSLERVWKSTAGKAAVEIRRLRRLRTFSDSFRNLAFCIAQREAMATHIADRNQECTVWVGGLEPQMTEELLYELMLQAGPIVQLNMPRDAVTQLHQVCDSITAIFISSIELSAFLGSVD